MYVRKPKITRDRYELNPAKCRTCLSVFPYKSREKTYCDLSCSAKHTNLVPKRKRRLWLCGCGNECRRNGKFCPICILAGLHVRRGDWTNVRSNLVAKKLLIDEVGHQCMRCKRKTWNGFPIPLELEHRDGNADNFSRENVELDCPNCHAQSPTYKGRNRSKGSRRQVMRMKRYYAGKTY
jgi:hypothetical protein